MFYLLVSKKKDKLEVMYSTIDYIMKKYYYILVFALSLFISACNQSPIEEGISKNIEKKQKETHYSFDMNVGFGGGKLDDPSLVNDLRSLNYNIDGSTLAIEGRGKLPEKDLNAIVYIRSTAGEGEILTAGTAVFKKVPGKNKFYCDKITFPLEPNYTGIHDLKIENNIIKYKYNKNNSSDFPIKNKELKHIYVNAILSYNPIEKEFGIYSDPYFRGTKYGYYSLSRYTIDNLKELYTKKNDEYNIDVPFIMENVKIEVKDGKLKVAEGEKPVMRPLGSLLFIKVNNKTDKPINFYTEDTGVFTRDLDSEVLFYDKFWPRLSFRVTSKDNYSHHYSVINLDILGIRVTESRIDSFLGYDRYNASRFRYLRRGQSSYTSLAYLIPTEKGYGKKLMIRILRRKIPGVHDPWIGTKWESNFPIANGTIYKANIDIDY